MKKYLLLLLCVISLSHAKTPEVKASSTYTAKDFNYLLGRLPGISDDLLKIHFTLYQGYIKNLNSLESLLVNSASMDAQIYAGLKRRFGWEYNGARLHELYFENLMPSEMLPMTSILNVQITKDFGSFENWQKDFFATGMMRGIGWVILYLDDKENRLHNVWIEEHQTNHLANGTPILVMDVWEHAYLTQFGLNREEYIRTFFKNIDWACLQRRFQETNNLNKK